MNRNGTEQMPPNGQTSFGVPAKYGEQLAGNAELEIARKIEQSISYMLQHLNQPLHVATLAAVVNVSPSHYSALFKRWMGCPPIDYFIHLRMQHACWLFDNKSLNVKEVAAALGYDDPFYFSRTFKSVNQVAPSEYRAMTEKQKNKIKDAALAFAAPTSPRQPNNSKEGLLADAGSWACESQTGNCGANASNLRTIGENKLK